MNVVNSTDWYASVVAVKHKAVSHLIYTVVDICYSPGKSILQSFGSLDQWPNPHHLAQRPFDRTFQVFGSWLR